MTPVDPTVITSLITAAGVVLAAVFALLGARYTQRQTRAAAERTAALQAEAAARASEVEQRKVDAQAFEHAKVTWRESISDLRERVDELAVENDRQRSTIRDLRTRVEELETGQERDRRHIRELTAYARDLLRILSHHEIAYPPPPVGLEER